MKAKGQIIGEVMIFIIAAVVFLLIIGYGYRAINSLMDKQQQASLIEVKTSTSSVIDRMKQNYGSVDKFSMTAPSSVKEICFVSSKDSAFTVDTKALESYRPQIFREWSTGAKNLFLSPIESYNMPNVRVESGFCCVKSSKVSWRVEGKGTYVSLRPWDLECNV